jgi:hypothetical protein
LQAVFLQAGFLGHLAIFDKLVFWQTGFLGKLAFWQAGCLGKLAL